jgi:hypothetical protein
LKKTSALTLLLTIAFISYLIYNIQIGNQNVQVIQESSTFVVDTQYDSLFLKDSDKHFFYYGISIVFIVLIGISKHLCKAPTWHFVRRSILFNPIFYESNYVIKPL